MFNNINDNSQDLLYSSQFNSASNIINLNAIRSSLQKTENTNNPYVDKSEISANAMELFQRDLDINKFTKIAMSDLNDISHLDLMNNLFSQGVVDVTDENILSELVTNSKLLDDLGL